MRPISNKSAGFTLVEVLIISPIIILFIGTFIGLLVNLTGDSLTVRERNLAVYDTQAALDDIQADISTATGFLSTTGTTPTSANYLPAPQGKDNTTSQAFTDTSVDGNGNRLPDALIMTSAATTKGPNDATREVIYLGSGACDSKNPAYTYITIYFVDFDTDTADTTDKALFKRTALPPASACDNPWQKGSCKRESMAGSTTVCKEKDEKLISGISDLDVKYFSATNTTGSDTGATTATDASINITVAKQVAGTTINYSSSTRTSGSNIQTVDNTSSPTPIPANSAIQASRTSPGPYPYRTVISWDRIGNATGYTAKYKVGTGAVQSVSISQPGAGISPTFNIDAAYRKQSVQLTELKVQTPSGTFDYGTLPTISDIPRWNECSTNSKWTNYGSVYNTAGFTKTSSGVVGLKGLMQLGDFVNSSAAQIGSYPNGYMCVLPVGFRPANRLIFQSASHDPTYGSGGVRIDIYPTGEVVAISSPSGSNAWVSMDGIMFMTTVDGTSSTNLTNPPATGGSTWQSGTYISPWYYYSYSDPYAPIGYYRDNRGRTWIQGIGTGGGTATIANLPATYRPTYGAPILPSASDSPSAVSMSPSGNSGNIDPRTTGNFKGLQFLFYSTSGMNNLTLVSPWVAYANGWASPQCFKGSDDIVIIQGLARSGGNAPIANLNGCGTGTGASNTDITMSTGKDALFPAWTNPERGGRLDLSASSAGYLYAITYDPGYTSLDAVHYIAD